jgi:hypothetical protein
LIDGRERSEPATVIATQLAYAASFSRPGCDLRPIRFRTLICNSDAENGFSRKSTLFGGNRLKFDTFLLAHQPIGLPEMTRTGKSGYNATSA